ncbi:MAG: hypothetical protein GX176_02610, partial [Syntrophomonadaceae bacterium]|nr:hypothetical protein [Syntrophomonadaceae bacterium]
MLRKPKFHKLLTLFMVLSLVLVLPLSAAGSGAAPENIIDNELVVSTLGEDGTITGMQVLNHIRVFGEGAYSIEDSSRFKLSSIRNLYSSDKINLSDGKINMNITAEGFSDLYYLAQLDQEEIAKVDLPVSVNLEYYLDGQKVQPSQMAGKSGQVKIVIEVENLTGEPQMLEFKDSDGETVTQEMMVYTPYAVSISGVDLDNSKFANIKAPGVAGESPEGVLANVQGVTSVSWTVPLIPPAYPAKQYVVLEADGKNIEMPSFNIGVMPILPTTSSIDNLTSSLTQLYDGFNQIHQGIGASNQDATLLYGLAAVKNGLHQVVDGLATVESNLKMIRVGLANPNFDASSYNMGTGTDGKGETPGAKDAIGLMKNTIDTQLLAAFGGQKMVLGLMETAIGTSADIGQEPSASTSLYNDINYLKAALAGTPAQQVITNAIEPKLNAMNHNVKVFRDGGEMVTSTGTMAFPASVSAVELGSKTLSEKLGQLDGGLTMAVIGLGALDENGQPVKVMANGKPASLLYALEYLQQSINGQMIPG